MPRWTSGPASSRVEVRYGRPDRDLPAVFASMLLDGSIVEKGVLAPEACVDPVEFRKPIAAAMPASEEAMQVEIEEIQSGP